MKFFTEFRKKEILVLVYRIFLVYLFYQIARLLFWFYNKNLIQIDNVFDYLKLAYHGIQFDTTAILYVNALFILLSLVPIIINTKKIYQKFLFWLYFITNGIAYGMNFGDFIYFRFSQARLTTAAMHVAQHENNLWKIFFLSIVQHPTVLLFFIALMFSWVFLYKKIRISEIKPKAKIPYFVWSIITLCIVATLAVGGIRGDFKHSTRPINLVDANKHVKNPAQANVVLNSVFSFFRTLGSNNFEIVHFVDSNFIDEHIKPYKLYERKIEQRPNIVILIVESLGREYIGAFNEHKKIPNYISYTPFLDSLATKSLIFPNSFANGRQSIHGMSSVLAGIPALKDAFTSSPFANQKIQSVVSIANEMGYDTSFYHGAPNGSMGFQGFGNILGFQHYFGKTEYNNDQDFDGMWAIWDEPFLQYFANNVGHKKSFLTTVFTASSHHPFKIPEKYHGKFKKGNIVMHEPIQYTDYAIKKYFETVSKKDWYHNTIFVITGDHTNERFYNEYQRAINGFAVPILFYSPNPTYNLKGVDMRFVQQMDIYPTLVDFMGYNKKFRSWGRSLVQPDAKDHLIINSDGILVNFIIGNYIYRFNGKEIEGIYDQNDLNLENNLKNKLSNTQIQKDKLKCKAWYQDYMDRIINKKLH